MDEVERGKKDLPATYPRTSRASAYTRMSRCWPTAATAWSVARSVGLGPAPMACHPLGDGPRGDDDDLQSRFAASTTTSSHNLPIAAVSTSPSAAVTDVDPIFTTMRPERLAPSACSRRVTCPLRSDQIASTSVRPLHVSSCGPRYRHLRVEGRQDGT